ncbi:unnamed protein product [Sphagnum troendelagicum]
MPVSSNMASVFRSSRTSFCSSDLEVVSCTQSLPIDQLQKPATFSVAGRIRKPLRIRCALRLPPRGSITTATTISVGNRSGSARRLKKELIFQSPADIEDPDVEKSKLRALSEEAFRDYQFLFRAQRNEVESIPLTVVEGAVPDDFAGVYYLCGSGILSDDHGSQLHPLDGHGYLRKFLFTGASCPVMYSARYIDTEARQQEFDKENKTWKFTYRGAFSLLQGGHRFGNLKVMKNVANTSVLQWAGRLMCLYEGGLPYEMDAVTLNTLGLFRLLSNPQGTLRSAAVGVVGKLIQPILKGVFDMPEERMLSHVKYDMKRRRLVVMTCRREDMVLPKSTFTMYELNTSMQVVQRNVFTLDEQLVIHDWGLTDNHYVLLANRVKLNSAEKVAGSLAGMAPMINCLSVDDTLPYTPLFLLPRKLVDYQTTRGSANNTGRDWRIPLKIPGRMWFIHTANAFEEVDRDGNIHLVLDGTACSYDWFSLLHMFGYEWQKKWLDPTYMNTVSNDSVSSPAARLDENPIQLVRVSTLLSPEGKEIRTECEEFENNKCACDFPALNPLIAGSRQEHTYLAAASGRRQALPYFPFDTLVKLSGHDATEAKVSSWFAGKRSFVGEPIFVPRSNVAKSPDSPDFREDDGYLLTIQYAAAEEVCYFVILDAQRIGKQDALVARLRLPAKYAFPFGFHGFWTDLDEYVQSAASTNTN